VARLLRVASGFAERSAAGVLHARGHLVCPYAGTAGALERIASRAPDLVVLECPDDDEGMLALLQRIRSRAECADLPVAIVTHLDDPMHTVRCLESGADTCIPWNVSDLEFAARIDALLRRRAPHAVAVPLSAGALTIDPVGQRVAVDGAPIPLDRLEFDLLRHLVAYPDAVQARSRLLARIWPDRDDVDLRTVDAYVARLREPLCAAGLEDAIETVRGVGYRWVGTARARGCARA
jgi:two-component system phosphate regulon response regulator PhoB